MSKSVRAAASRWLPVCTALRWAAVVAAASVTAATLEAAILPSVSPVSLLPGQTSPIIVLSINYGAVGAGGTGTVVFSGLPGGVATIPVPPDSGPGPVTFPFSPLVGSAQTAFRLQVGAAVPPGTYPIIMSTVPEIGAGTGLLTLVVQQPPSFTASISPNPVSLGWATTPVAVTVSTFPDAGFAEAITYSFVGFPPGITTGGGQTVASPYPPATFGFSAAAGTAPGSYSGFLQASWGMPLQTRTFPMVVVVQQPDIAVSFAQGVLEICNGGAPAANAVTLQPVNGYAGTPSLAFVAVPAGVAVTPGTLVTPPLPPAQTLPFSVQASGAAPGTHLLSLQVSDPAAAIAKTAAFTATVVDPAFTPVVTPAALTAQAGGAAATLQVSLTRNACFSAPSVHVAVTGAPAGVTVSPSPAVLEAPAYLAVSLGVLVAPAVPAGTYPLILTFTPASGAARTVPVALTVTPAPDFSLGVTPASLTVVAGNSANVVVSILPLNGFAGVAAVAAGPSPGFTVNPGQFQVAAGGAQSVAIGTTAATSPGSRVLQFTATAPGVPGEKVASLVVQVVPPPPVITGVAPPALATGTSSTAVRLAGREFRPGAVITSSSPGLVVIASRVISATLAEATVTCRGDLTPGAYELRLTNVDGTTTAEGGTVLVYPASSLAAPLGVTAAAVVFPRPYTVVAADTPIFPRALLATTGSGTVVGSWLLDGIPFDQFAVPVAGGMPAPVEARVPLPVSWSGEHRLELVIERPQHVAVEPVVVLMALDSRSGLTLLGPGDGEVIQEDDTPVFRWSLVPGASGYELEIHCRDRDAPRLIRLSAASWRAAPRELSGCGSGEHRWRVRAVFPGEVRGEPTPWRLLLVEPPGGAAGISGPGGWTYAVLTTQDEVFRLASQESAADDAVAEAEPARRDWEVSAQATSIATEEGGSVQGEAVQVLVSSQIDVAGGSGEFQATLDASGSRELRTPRDTTLESRNWQVTLASVQEGYRQEARVGYAPPSFLDQSEYLAVGLARGGGQGTLVTPVGSMSYYQTFSQMPAAAVGCFAPEQRIRAVGLELPGDPARFLLRAFALRTEGAASPWSPSGRGEAVGFLGRLVVAPSLSLIFEGAHGAFEERSGEDAAGKRSGEGFRLGLSGSGGGFFYSAAFRRTDADFINPVNPGFTPGGVGDRTGADLSVGRAFGRAMVSVQLNRLDSSGETTGTGRARQEGGSLSLSFPLGARVAVAVAANTAATEGGGNAALGLPDVNRRTRGASVSLSERMGAFSVSQMLGWQEVADTALPGADLTTTMASLSATGGVAKAIMLSAMLSGTRSDGGPLSGRTDQVLISLQPTMTAGRWSLTPRVSWSRMTNDVWNSENCMKQYQVMVQWSPPWFGDLFALQVAADWSRMDSGAGPRPSFQRRVTATFSLRRTLSGVQAQQVAPAVVYPTS